VLEVSPRLVLASTSRYRIELLQRLGIPFETRAPSIDERAFDDAFATSTAEDFARRLALAKAEAVAAEIGDADAWVLGADQLAILPTDPPLLLHKPGTSERAIDQLMQLAGREHHLVTGVALVGPRRLTATDRVTLRMRAFDREEATAYVERYTPLDCVGSYRIEDAGIRLFETLAGSADPTSIMGLPLLAVCHLLREAGLLV
jgi:septum formation protein